MHQIRVPNFARSFRRWNLQPARFSRGLATNAFITEMSAAAARKSTVPDIPIELLDVNKMPAGWKAPIAQAENNTFQIAEELKFRISGRKVTMEGPKGIINCVLPNTVQLGVDKDTGIVTVLKTSHKAPARTFASLLRNFSVGVLAGHRRKLAFQGIGYKVRKMDESEGKGKESLDIRCGFTHPVYYSAPEGVSFEVAPTNDQLTVKGTDLSLVGRVASEIRKIQPPNVYTGKGIRYAGEEVKLKPKKKAK
jgi:large subunit ribosomal protein L6